MLEVWLTDCDVFWTVGEMIQEFGEALVGTTMPPDAVQLYWAALEGQRVDILAGVDKGFYSSCDVLFVSGFVILSDLPICNTSFEHFLADFVSGDQTASINQAKRTLH